MDNNNQILRFLMGQWHTLSSCLMYCWVCDTRIFLVETIIYIIWRRIQKIINIVSKPQKLIMKCLKSENKIICYIKAAKLYLGF